MTFARASIALLLLGVVLGSAACAATAAESRASALVVLVPDDDVPPPSEQVLRLHLPLDQYIQSIDETYAIEGATDRLVRRCMADRGLPWPLVGRPVFGDWRNRRRYGVVEPLVAQRFGFHAVPALLAPVQVYNDEARRTNSLTDRQRIALSNPKTGCEATAAAEIRRGVNEPDYSLANRLGAQSLYDAERRPDVRLALDRWSQCMLASGSRYPDPLTASADRRWSTTEKATPQEIAAAETSVRCAEQVNLVQSWSTADAAIQRAMIAEHPTYFAAMAATKSQLLTTAKKILRSGD